MSLLYTLSVTELVAIFEPFASKNPWKTHDTDFPLAKSGNFQSKPQKVSLRLFLIVVCNS